MPQRSWSEKDDRKYGHIKKSQRQQGKGTDRAEEIAARTVNKDRAQEGRTRQASRSSLRDTSSSRRGGRRSGTDRPKGRTKEQLYNEAKKLGVEGRSKMTKQQLQRAVSGHKGGKRS